MHLELTDRRWRELRAALDTATDRFVELLLACRTPDRQAVGRWTAAETAAHTAIVADLNAGLLHAPSAPLGLPEVDRFATTTTLGGLAHLNDVALREFPERSPEAVARRLRAGVSLLLDRSADLDPLGPATWLGSAPLPVASLLAHQLNETLLHGFDVAQAMSRPWPVPSAEAALAFDLFLVPLLGCDTDRLFGDDAGQGRRVHVEFRSRHTTPVVLASGGGRVGAEPPGREVDARVRFEPGALMLVVFRRKRLVPAVATGRIVASGRRPWAAVTYLRRMRTP
ncbi:maleylpyruvate isomerase N-terminal domain-containing protein [Saccharothrix australiensis]|uniref:Mycothiol maleylpyruvate isomerase-like protein n=1 Tax=Saccharothrix australiensis TaxID=2072 RepID=A0A495VWE6_9PSEU|nr:maleylpyruvate isomerase N-terminal domain-containing protein [Saccharothrix australiensis]RKT53646.1 mycothiol maleylpyruvate isomerase-like protein [Saccharothrix australiensis]